MDGDKGPEFLDWNLITLRRDRIQSIENSRSRTYHKNDKANNEKKDRTQVRELLGEDRLGAMDLAPLLVELHTLWRDFHNFLLPTLTLIKKERHRGRNKKIEEPEAHAP